MARFPLRLTLVTFVDENKRHCFRFDEVRRCDMMHEAAGTPSPDGWSFGGPIAAMHTSSLNAKRLAARQNQ
jgi:hypothetical protein